MIRPAQGAQTFNPGDRPGGTPGFGHYGDKLANRAQIAERQVKRHAYANEHGEAVAVWDVGCQTAAKFAETGDV